MRLRLVRISFAGGLVLLFSLLVCSELHAQELGNIYGQIRLPDGTSPAERIYVSLEGRGAIINSMYCDNDGGFGFYNLVPNPYYVVIEAEGYQPIRHQVVVRPTISQNNLIHIVLRPVADAKPRGSSESEPLADPDVVDVSELSKKYPAAALKDFEAGRKAELRGETDNAVRLYQSAIQQAPDFYPAHNNLGIRYLQKGDLKSAEAQFRRVLELNANSAQAYFNLGNVLYITKRNQEAEQTLEEGLRRAPSSAKGRFLMGSVLVRMGNLSAAEAQLKTARELDPKMPQAPIALATLYLQAGRKREASDMFESFLRQFPKDPMVPKVRDALSKISAHPSP